MRARIAQESEEDGGMGLFDDAIALCSSVLGADDIRVALLRLNKATLAFSDGQFRKARDEAEALLPIFTAYGLDDRIAEASLLRLVAAYKTDDPKWEDEYLDHAEKWTAYAYGDDNDLTQKLRR